MFERVAVMVFGQKYRNKFSPYNFPWPCGQVGGSFFRLIWLNIRHCFSSFMVGTIFYWYNSWSGSLSIGLCLRRSPDQPRGNPCGWRSPFHFIINYIGYILSGNNLADAVTIYIYQVKINLLLNTLNTWFKLQYWTNKYILIFSVLFP